MNKHLQELIKVANLDKEIDALEPKITQKQEPLNALLNELSDKESQILETNANKQDISNKIRNANIALAEASDNIQKIANKSSEIKNERELKNISIEQELASERIDKINDDIAILEKELEQKDALLSDLKAAIEDLKQKIEVEKEAISDEIKKIRDEQKKLFSKKETLYKKLDSSIAIFYQKIRRWAKNTSVVPVQNQACQGCFIRINDRVYANIKSDSEIVTCPHCGRILFLDHKSAI
ncbi:MAG: C4-type zinc ribbon domain-containing protein [Helicobacter sp.]|nr:C4-type zinc ribbon domain-containing protein [Helicobacter sp.]